MKKLILFIFLFAYSLPAVADLSVTYKTKQGEKNVYWTEHFYRSVDKGSKQDYMVDFDQGVMYQIDHKTKKIRVTSLNALAGMMGSMSQMMGQAMDMPGMKGKTMGANMLEGMNKSLGDPDAAVLQKLGVEQIAGRSCDSYRVERKGKSLGMSEEVCIDTTLIPPGANHPAMAKMGEASEEMMGGLSGFQSAGQKDLGTIKGLTLKRVVKSSPKGMARVMMFGGGKSEGSEEATLVKEGPVDASVFKLPPDYQQVDMATEMQMEMQKAQETLDKMGR